MTSFDSYLISLNLPETQYNDLNKLYKNLSETDQGNINTLITSVPEYDVEKLMFLIQPLWNKIHQSPDSVSEIEHLKLLIGIKDYQRRGLDMEYLTNGAGAPGNCLIL